MRTALLTIVATGVLWLAGSAPAVASDVNCGIVMKSVKMGRSAQDIAETMLISVEDVEKCKAEAAKAEGGGQPAAADKPAAEKPAAADTDSH